MGGMNQIGKEAVTFHFCLRWVHHVLSKEFLSISLKRISLPWKCESLNAKILKSSMDKI